MGRHLAILLQAALLLAACSAIPPRPEPPRVTLVDLRLAEATVFAQRYEIELDVENPNPFDLPIDGVACELWLNGQLFATGVGNRAVTVPRYGRARLPVEITGTLAGILRQINELDRGELQGVRYRLRGHANVPGTGRLPFDYGGEFGLPPRDLERGN